MPTSQSDPPSSQLRFSCADWAFPRLSHDVALAVIRDLDIEAVDIFVLAGSPHTAAEAVEADPVRAAGVVQALVAKHGLKVADVFAIFGDSFEAFAPNHPDDAIRDRSRRQFDALVEFSRRIAAAGMTVLPGIPFEGVDDKEGLVLAASELERRAQIAGDAGLRLSVEPHFDSIIPTPARTEPFLELTKDVGITLDVSHFTYQGIAQSESDALLGRTTHVHLRQARRDVMQARVCEGTIDFPALRDRLLAIGYDAYFGLEYQWEEHWLDFTHVDCITETAELRDLMVQGA